MLNPQLAQAMQELTEALMQTDEYQRYTQLRESVLADAASSALLRRFQSAQTALQLAALSGREAAEEDAAAFEGLSGLLYANQETADYLLAEMQLQQLVAQLMQQLTQAAGLDVPLPEI